MKSLGRFLRTVSRRGKSAEEIQQWMQVTIGEALGVAGDTLDPCEPFTSYGLDSIAAFTLTVELAEWLDRDLPATLFWEYSTIAELAGYLAETQDN